jgi:hypothetical protein
MSDLWHGWLRWLKSLAADHNPKTTGVSASNIPTSNIKIYRHLSKVGGFSPGTLVSSTNKTDSHDITEILLKVA